MVDQLSQNRKELHLFDAHTHIGEIAPGKGQTADQLIMRMDSEGIERSVVLSLENPEETYYYVLSREVLEACSENPDRLVPFCCVDPRRGSADTSTDFLSLIDRYVQRGAKGFGEHLAGLAIDDPRSMKIYEACGYLGVPIVFHTDRLRNYDEVGLPGLERVVSTMRETIFIAHGPGWWKEISAEVDPDVTYPKGPIVPGGRVGELLDSYGNLFADISAGSGYNALSRDPEYGAQFLSDHSEKLLFGTDCIHPEQELAIIDFLVEAEIPKREKQRISHLNIERILGIS
jgi:hypothetical protein